VVKGFSNEKGVFYADSSYSKKGKFLEWEVISKTV